MEGEGLQSMAWETHYGACAHCTAMGDRQGAAKWAARAAESAALAMGRVSEEHVRFAALVPGGSNGARRRRVGRGRRSDERACFSFILIKYGM